MKVDLLNHMGDDLTVVNAARVSFDNRSEWEVDYEGCAGDLKWEEAWKRKSLPNSDIGLIAFLARNQHFTPFTHCMITFRVKAPIFVARQLWKSHVGLVGGDYGPIGWNEISRRYVDSEPEFYMPKVWRGKPKNAKQGSDGKPDLGYDEINKMLEVETEVAETLYTLLLAANVAPEQARMVLPQSMYTEWYWTGSLAAFARVCKLRLDSHAQSETREIAQMIADHISPLFPISWPALMED